MNMMIRKFPLVGVLLLCVSGAFSADEVSVMLFNGKDLSGWNLVNPAANDCWKIVSGVSLDHGDPKKLTSSGDGGSDAGILFRGDVPHGSDLYSEKNFGD